MLKSKENLIVYQNGLQCQTVLLANIVLPIQEQRALLSFSKRMNYPNNNYKRNNIVEYCQCEPEYPTSTYMRAMYSITLKRKLSMNLYLKKTV